MQQAEVLSDEWTSETPKGYAINSVFYDPELMAAENSVGYGKNNK